MKIYRSILLNEGEKVNPENIGCSWTLDYVFAEDHAEDINRLIQKDGYIILEAEVSEEDIDMDNTLFAMENRPSEFEVVVYGDITCTVFQMDGVDYDDAEAIVGNTGDADFEDYCEKYEGDLTSEDFRKLANEYN